MPAEAVAALTAAGLLPLALLAWLAAHDYRERRRRRRAETTDSHEWR